MSSSSQGRVVIGLCMDKERDEKLLNFLSSQKNKSDFIRTTLYEKMANLEKEEEDSVFNGASSILKDILYTLNTISSNISNVHLSSKSTNASTVSYISNSEHSASGEADKNNNYLDNMQTTQSSNDDFEDDSLFAAVADSFGAL